MRSWLPVIALLAWSSASFGEETSSGGVQVTSGGVQVKKGSPNFAQKLLGNASPNKIGGRSRDQAGRKQAANVGANANVNADTKTAKPSKLFTWKGKGREKKAAAQKEAVTRETTDGTKTEKGTAGSRRSASRSKPPSFWKQIQEQHAAALLESSSSSANKANKPTAPDDSEHPPRSQSISSVASLKPQRSLSTQLREAQGQTTTPSSSVEPWWAQYEKNLPPVQVYREGPWQEKVTPKKEQVHVYGMGHWQEKADPEDARGKPYGLPQW